MLKHIVMWKFDSDETVQEAKKRLEELPAQIPEICKFEAGVNISSRPAALDLVLYSSFKNRDDLATYAEHPAHVAVASFIKAHAQETRVVDYEIPEM
ncbi:Dabb family protein [Chitinivibrio alkaliphilus]|uniref:Stress responsive alpha-beta barrel domain-containing protein n=1 Tax=Chitinivibrio alkaliphilus ACht1 TaxID=1313304 RepID=U7DA90_9BACT|nr:Dabb family protein [Chitinivibrio alkaliphilus]ERP39309.1 Stress responsive alpha-beta barrel domain-containing protein [Chitinivibrio alkaliphilus ACht1]